MTLERVFEQDGWTYRVKERAGLPDSVREISVHCKPAYEDWGTPNTLSVTCRSVGVETFTDETTLFGLTLWETAYKDHDESHLPPLEDHVAAAVAEAKEMVDDQEKLRTERFEDGIETVRGDGQ